MTTKFDELCQELETIWHQQIPLSAAMRMQVALCRCDVVHTMHDAAR